MNEQDAPTGSPIAVDSVLPHAHPMILIDEVRQIGGVSTESTVRIGEDAMFYERTLGVPAYVGIEYIAQTVATHAGALALAKEDPVRVGFLLGTRHYHCTVPYFPLGARLTVRVHALYQASNLSKFRGTISQAGRSGERELASCAVSVYLRDGTEGEP